MPIRPLTAATTAAPTPAGAVHAATRAEPVPVLPVGTAVPEVEQRFRSDPRLRGVVTRWRGSWHLVTRPHLDAALSGRFGYGRALLERRDLSALLPLETVVVRGNATLTHAAEMLVSSLPLVTDVVVDDDGQIGLIPAAVVLAALADGYRLAALTDALTGLPNRLAVQSGEVLLGGHPAAPPALLYVDLDRFKQVNDTYGHRAGDGVLVEFAQRLQSCLRPQDVVARVGGDEFVVLLDGADEMTACAVAERIVLTAAAPFVVDGHVVTTGASVGIALPGDTDGRQLLSPSEVLLHHADAAMYRAKASGRGQWARLDDTGQDVGPPMSRRLRAALEGDRLQVHYQPKVALVSGRVVEVEALCRWQEPDLGSIPPSTFIPLAEQVGLIVPLGRWVLEQACAQARSWLDEGRDLRVAVNVSAVQLARPELVDEVTSALARAGLPADRLRLEITESAALSEPLATVTRLRRLAALGVQLSLDDFGTRYSSLSLLRSLPVHGLKIDKSFVDGVDTDHQDAAMVRLLVELGHRLGLTVIAEGVERNEQLAVLRDLGCDAVQGYLLGRPVPAGELVLA